jgi:hypothetical protein
VLVVVHFHLSSKVAITEEAFGRQVMRLLFGSYPSQCGETNKSLNQISITLQVHPSFNLPHP